jgi:site-specific DNA-methyltransferase (adenine-specific)
MRRYGYLTVAEAAALLGVTPTTLRNWDRSGKLKAVRHPVNGYRLYPQAELEALLLKVQETPLLYKTHHAQNDPDR